MILFYRQAFHKNKITLCLQGMHEDMYMCFSTLELQLCVTAAFFSSYSAAQPSCLNAADLWLK